MNWSIDILNGLAYGGLLFVIASGLNMTIGMMHRVNLAHGALFLVGGYLALDIADRTGNYLIGLLAGVVGAFVIGLVLERFLLQRVADSDVAQILLTVGAGLLIQDQIRARYTANPLTPPTPPGLDGSSNIGGAMFPTLKLATLALAIVLAIAMTMVLKKTKLGALVRASVDDNSMARSVGVRVPWLYMWVFGAGGALAGFAGVWGGSYLSLEPELGWEILLLGLVVIVIGGLDSIGGAFLAAMIIGLLTQFGRLYFPSFASFFVYGIAVFVLLVRPNGLLGRVVTREA